MSSVLLITNLLFPPEPPPAEETAGPAATVAATAGARPAARLPAAAATSGPADSVVVRSPLYRYVISTRGAALVGAELPAYRSYVDEGTAVQLVPDGTADFLTHRVVVGNDTLDLGTAQFQPSARTAELREGQDPLSIRFVYNGGNGVGAEITYTFRPDSYLIGVSGRLLGLGGAKAELLTDFGPAIAPHEAADHRSERDLSLVARTADGDIERVRLLKIEGTESLPGPLTWIGLRDKYFLAALLTGDRPGFRDVAARSLPVLEMPRPGEKDPIELPRAEITADLPVGADGTFAYDVYLGPQEYDRLSAIGFDLEEVTPYAYQWLQPIIRPFAALILQILAFLHNNLGLAYGWVLVLFGVMMRVILWPLNAKAMRAQMKNMAVQPLVQEIRDKHKDNPQKQQEAMIGLYKEHGFNPVAGCLPMLIPFPVLITLFFVFQNSIVFRGADFLWLPDLSLRDPFYILPVFLVLSMLALQVISTRISGMEQNAQMKTMLYVMPLVMGAIFFNLPAGLNLYYATTNVATIPQQLMIAKERRRVQEQIKEDASAKRVPAVRTGDGARSAKKPKRGR